MSKKIFLRFSILYLFLTNILFADTSSNLEIKILKNLRCLICQGQSIYDSQSDFAESMKIVVRKKLESGMTEKEIYNFLKNKYGNWILYEPQFEKNTLFLWLIPIFLFILGGILILKKIEVLKK
tara:strand:+ start:32 stop:403 length:372 start_codon:yes stop_codon:yes gene_type:complete